MKVVVLPNKSKVLFQEHNFFEDEPFPSYALMIWMWYPLLPWQQQWYRRKLPQILEPRISRDKWFLSFTNGISRRNITNSTTKVTEASLILKRNIYNLRNNMNFIMLAQIIFLTFSFSQTAWDGFSFRILLSKLQKVEKWPCGWRLMRDVCVKRIKLY